MKKLIALLLSILMVLGVFAGCASQSAPAASTDKQEEAAAPVASEEAALPCRHLEWRPCLNGDVFQTAVFQNTAITVDTGIIVHICIDAGVDDWAVGNTELQLVDDHWLITVFIQQFDLHWSLVAYTKVTDFATSF